MLCQGIQQAILIPEKPIKDWWLHACEFSNSAGGDSISATLIEQLHGSGQDARPRLLAPADRLTALILWLFLHSNHRAFQTNWICVINDIEECFQ